ncbi:thioredoxin family protein [Mariniblastus fucicola]|uniref:Thioredoxin domain-containing protein n=1 Tax=Mariniblastus fucicola TaxID=980251 RepID=A0A5B9PMF6_9BACT|nr:thioredoxin family protein [Mariniblastus fucicola]QEG23771.1 hypothetical protein MFFC18_36730 [Mariniblastus fucicola]
MTRSTIIATSTFWLATFVGSSIAISQETPKPDLMMAVAFSIGELPVWSLDKEKNPVFDGSVVLSRIKNEIEPELWKSDKARLIATAENESLILIAPRSRNPELANRISSLLQRMSAFAEHDVNSRLAKNLELAEIGGERVILVCTDADSMFSDRFHQALSDQSQLQKLVDNNYIVQYVPRAKASELKDKGIQAPPELGATLSIVTETGEPVAQMEFETWDESSLETLTGFAKENSKGFADATALLQDGLRAARKSKRKVLLQMGGPSCGPCILLSRYLNSHKEVIEKDFVYVKTDTRMANADQIKEKYGPDFSGIPWMVMLSADGELLASGMSPKGNIAFPRARYQKAHFKKMLESTAEKMTEADIARLMQSLPETPDWMKE